MFFFSHRHKGLNTKQLQNTFANKIHDLCLSKEESSAAAVPPADPLI